MNVITRNASAEISIKNSRFLAETFAVSTQEEARILIKTQKERHADATHVVHAFVIGPTGGILGCSDDGEPSGTAGRPALDILKGSGITNIMLTITRWFGGTLLGTGGLVKAYGEAARAVLAVTQSEELVAMKGFTLSVPYELYDRVKREVSVAGIEIVHEAFGTDIVLIGRVRDSLVSWFSGRISDLTSGKSSVVLSEESPTVHRI